MEKRPRFAQLCLFYWDDRILVFEGKDEHKGETFYRCMGGGLEYGEHLEAGLRREIMEKLGKGIEHIYPLGLANCVYQWEGGIRHRIFLVYDARIRDTSFYTKDKFEIEDEGETLTLQWKKLDDFENGDILYPTGLLAFIERFRKHKDRLNWIMED
ncbi:MAG: 8-oxo-dGTP pyrophosphatase MutT (NUDIX family) [Maribacter sp.]|jgi:8-oxo-dGTP pyrophosphatase MutT (NUDIX family)